MSEIFVIPDVHLKPWIYDKAEELLCQEHYDHIVMLGDVVDDWFEEKNLELYDETVDRLTAFVKEHNNTYFCFGNHDLSYLWAMVESGYSFIARDLVVRRMRELINVFPKGRCAYIHRFENVLFSHAGLTTDFVIRHFAHESSPDIDNIIGRINQMGVDEMWNDISPIWYRPNAGGRAYPFDMLQVVGHTPVKMMEFVEDNFCVVDTFSTYKDGTPYGNQRFVKVNTSEKTVHQLMAL